MKTSLLRKGFTLIELLLVIGIIAILASIVIVAINPTKQLGDARDAQRRSDVNTILNAVYQYSIDHKGDFPGCLASANNPVSGTAYHICATTCTGVTTNPCALASSLVSSYIVKMPLDPSVAVGTEDTNYTISIDTTAKRITVTAPGKEQSTDAISVTR